MITPQPLRRLTLTAAQGAPDRLSAASGIVVAGEFLYVIADDELHLGVFDLGGQDDGRWLRLFAGELPEAAAERKALKPDLEALVRLPPFAGYPGGALLALPSGSRPNRQTGALLGLQASGALSGDPRAVDLSALYAPLLLRFPALNIEGAVIREGELVLLQRASGAHPDNALIGFALSRLLEVLSADEELRLPELAARVTKIDLGHIDGVPLGFTDAAVLPDGRLVFSAVAENVDDTYHDGPCVGAVIGVLGLDGQVQGLERLDPVLKIEGVDARQEGAVVRLLLVTDADDRAEPGVLLSASLSI